MSHDLSDWPEHRAAPGYADRVMASLAPAPRVRTRRAAIAGFAGGAAVAALTTWAVMSAGRTAPAPAPDEGALVAEARTRAALGDAAIVVAEPGAEVRWGTRDGRLEVEQPRGRVFYRAARPLGVRTPTGVLDVTGTSFSVDSAPARTDLIVYEGTVVAVQGARRVEVGAGRRIRLTARGIEPARPAPWLDDAPVATAPVVAARVAPAPPCDPAAEGEDVAAPPAATLAAWAAACRLHFDVAPNGYDAGGLEHYLDLLDLTAEERPVVRETILAIEARANDELARQYLDVTGDERGRDQLSIDWMFSEVMRSADPDEPAEVRRRLARERAGLDPAAAAATPYEAQVRWLMRSGEVLERELAAALGPARARALRARHRGWPGLRWDVAGCPRAAE